MKIENIKVKLLPDFPVKVLITNYESNAEGEIIIEITIAEMEEEGK